MRNVAQLDVLPDLTTCCCRTDQEWLLRVFGIPLLLLGIAASRFAYVRHKRPEQADDAAGNFHSHVFGIVFIVYRASLTRHPELVWTQLLLTDV